MVQEPLDTFTLDGRPEDFFTPDEEFIRKWAARRGIDYPSENTDADASARNHVEVPA